MDVFVVELTSQVQKDLKKIPHHIVIKLMAWIDDVNSRGLQEVRKTPGYHDEALKGDRKEQRSIRLSKAYRAIYIIDKNKNITFLKVVEVNKHEY